MVNKKINMQILDKEKFRGCWRSNFNKMITFYSALFFITLVITTHLAIFSAAHIKPVDREAEPKEEGEKKCSVALQLKIIQEMKEKLNKPGIKEETKKNILSFFDQLNKLTLSPEIRKKITEILTDINPIA